MSKHPPVDEGLLHAYLEGLLSPEEVEKLEVRFADSDEWTEALNQARALNQQASRILDRTRPDREPPPPLEDLNPAVAEADRGLVAHSSGGGTWLVVGLVAGLLAGGGGSWLLAGGPGSRLTDTSPVNTAINSPRAAEEPVPTTSSSGQQADGPSEAAFPVAPEVDGYVLLDTRNEEQSLVASYMSFNDDSLMVVFRFPGADDVEDPESGFIRTDAQPVVRRVGGWIVEVSGAISLDSLVEFAAAIQP